MSGRNFDKLEAGKTYRLIDKEGYFASYSRNKEFFSKFAINGCFTLNGVNFIFGYIVTELGRIKPVITKYEAKYFELVEENKVESKELNYSGNWCVKLPDTQAEREVFKKIFDDVGVEWWNTHSIRNLSNTHIGPWGASSLIGYRDEIVGEYYEEISIPEAIIRLQTPKESEEERLTREAKERKIEQIEELEMKAKELQETIMKMKEEM